MRTPAYMEYSWQLRERTKRWRVEGALLIVVQVSIDLSNPFYCRLQLMFDLIPQSVVSCIANVLTPVDLRMRMSLEIVSYRLFTSHDTHGVQRVPPADFLLTLLLWFPLAVDDTARPSMRQTKYRRNEPWRAKLAFRSVKAESRYPCTSLDSCKDISLHTFVSKSSSS